MPTILGANSVSGGYEIDNSLRFNDGDSAELTRTPGSEGDKQKHTFSMWVKRCTSGANQALFSAGASDSLVYLIRFIDDALYLAQGGNFVKATNRLFRDPSAWYHIVVAMDSTQSTLNDRIKIYINGVLETSFSENTYNGGQNLNLLVNDDVIHAVGYDTLNNSVPFDGYISEFHLIDGTQLAASDFGEFNDNGVWIPKAYTGSYGTNGVYLEFKQTGTGTNASGMGADTSGNTHHYAPVNLTATDVTTDTPTNNFATINSLANYFNPAALSEGNTRVDFDNGTSTVYNISTIGVASGKWYCEVKAVDVPSYGEIGIASRPCIAAGNSDKLTFNEFNYGYTANNGNVKSNNTGGSSYGDSFTDGDMIGIALDLDNNKLYFSKNGTFQNSGDPTTGATGTGAVSIQAPSGTIDGVYYFAGGDNKNSDTTRMDFNFGNPAFALDSGNADANGYGNFEYAVPSGYYSLCTKNLGEFG
jgi:hypothetical protein